MQKLVDAWYLTLDWIAGQPRRGHGDHGRQGRAVAPSEYERFAEGTTIFTAEQALDAFADRAGDPTSLPEMARRINPFLVESGLTEKRGRPRRPLRCPSSPRPTSTARRVDRRGAGRRAGGTAPARRADVGAATPRPRGRPVRRDRRHAWPPPAPAAADPQPRSASAGGSASASLGVARAVRRLGGAVGPRSTAPRRSWCPRPAATWDAFVGDGRRRRRSRADLVGVAHAGRSSATRSRWRSASSLGIAIGTLRVGRGVLRAADRVPALHPGQRAHAAVPAVARASARARRSG